MENHEIPPYAEINSASHFECAYGSGNFHGNTFKNNVRKKEIPPCDWINSASQFECACGSGNFHGNTFKNNVRKKEIPPCGGINSASRFAYAFGFVKRGFIKLRGREDNSAAPPLKNQTKRIISD